MKKQIFLLALMPMLVMAGDGLDSRKQAEESYKKEKQRIEKEYKERYKKIDDFNDEGCRYRKQMNPFSINKIAQELGNPGKSYEDGVRKRHVSACCSYFNELMRANLFRKEDELDRAKIIFAKQLLSSKETPKKTVGALGVLPMEVGYKSSLKEQCLKSDGSDLACEKYLAALKDINDRRIRESGYCNQKEDGTCEPL